MKNRDANEPQNADEMQRHASSVPGVEIRRSDLRNLPCFPGKPDTKLLDFLRPKVPIA